MKNLKTFEELNYSTGNKNYEISEVDFERIYNGDIDNIITPTDIKDFWDFSMELGFFKDKEHLTREHVKNIYDFALSRRDVEQVTSILTYFITAHPYIKKEFPDLLIDFAKRWYDVQKAAPNVDFDLMKK